MEDKYTGWLFHVEHGAKGFKNITLEEKADLFRDGWVGYHDRNIAINRPTVPPDGEQSLIQENDPLSVAPINALNELRAAQMDEPLNQEEDIAPVKRLPGRPRKVKT